MKSALVAFLALFAVTNAHAQTQEAEAYVIDEKQVSIAENLMQAGLESKLAYQIVESLTTEIGPRLGGSEAEQRAREWGVKLGKALSFDRVSVEEFTMPYWERGEMEISLSSPYKQELYGTALGGSGQTSETLDAPVVYFRSLNQLQSIAAGDLKGKIAFVDGDAMVKSQTGGGYGAANQRRRVGWQHAERGDALALVVRSVGSDFHRFPHTGMMSAMEVEKEGGKANQWASIPVIAISNPDADHLRRLHKLGEKLSMTLHSTAGWKDDAKSGNVVLDIIGREKPDEIVLIGGHLDSWDLGTGAVDDGAGVAITTAAAELIARLPKRPRRTIRVIMFGAEEVGLLGAKAYAKQHEAELSKHVLATESDFGADTIWQFVSNVNKAANPAIDAISRVITPLGIVRGPSDVKNGGPGIIPLAMQGVPTIRLNQNGMDYFDLHHTPDDTLDKIDPDKLAQNVAAYAAVIYLAAELDVEFRPETP